MKEKPNSFAFRLIDINIDNIDIVSWGF